ncbi:MAG TPA: SGNH/GDSL hydrolase family protein [Anaerolineae bacterium]|nr:SGNH/GDSL hydrolase family protein [Anaerolineae bacterium]
MKRLSITILSASAYLVLYLVRGTAPAVPRSPLPLEAAKAAPVVAPTVSGLGDGSTSVVSCLGDSITNGYPYAGTDKTYPARLEVMLEATYGSGSYDVINRGVNGYRADQVLADLQNEGWLTEDNPDFVLLMVGGNDLAQETGGDPLKLPQVISDTVAEVQDIVDIVTAHTNPDGSHPQIIVSAFPPNRVSDIWGSAAVALYNSSLESDLTGVDLWFTSNWDDFYDPNTGQAKASLMYDEVHPNEAGYAVMAENWFGALNSSTHHLYLPLILRDH